MRLGRQEMTASEGNQGRKGGREKGGEEEGRLPTVIDSFQYLRFAARHVIIYPAPHAPDRPRPLITLIVDLDTYS